jgi:hypothetical protein
MVSRNELAALMLGAALVLVAVDASAEPQIGIAASTRPNAEAGVGANKQTLVAGTAVYANQTVRTGNLGMADLVFIDKTNLSVGPGSEVLLDKFIYDPTGSTGRVVLQATRGTFRFVTGSQAKKAYELNTPYGTLGVRGTVVEMNVTQNPKCATQIRLVEGGANFTTKTGKVANLREANQVACISESGNITYSTSSQSILSFSADQQQAPPPASVPGTGGGVTPPSTPPCVSPSTPNCT